MVDRMKDIIANEIREPNNMFEFNRCFYENLSATINDHGIQEKFTAVKAHAESDFDFKAGIIRLMCKLAVYAKFGAFLRM